MEEDFFIVRPATGQRIPLGPRFLPDPRPDVFPGTPKIGLAISTYAGLPQVELALAVRKLLYPDLPTLVHDDASKHGEQLAELCARYGVDFETNSSRLGHQMGDLSALVGGLRWGDERGLDVVVKMSRRFIPLTNWVPGLTRLAQESQYPTYSNQCQYFNLPIRSECIAMAVREWSADDIAGEICRHMLRHMGWSMAETYLVEFARKLDARKCDAARAWAAGTSEFRHHPGYAIWDFISNSRAKPAREHLWHTANGPEAYAAAACNLGLSFTVQDFQSSPDK